VNSESWNALIESLIQEGILRSPSVIRAMQQVPRDKFLPEGSKAYSAVDSPLPIGWGQTVSAPHSKLNACRARHGLNNE
jgi:protein-L-isoaspartate(D-aspartate) O-methyltransferase